MKIGAWLLLGLVLVGSIAAASSPKVRETVVALMTSLRQAGVRSDQPKQVVVLDSWWSGDYAKTGCAQAEEFMKTNRSLINQIGCDAVTVCPDVMPRYTACRTAFNGPAAVARQFENELMTQFTINSSCKGVTFARYYGPNEKISAAVQAAIDKRHWLLIIDYNVGALVQAWTLQDHEHRLFHQAEGNTAEKIAADVCAIVMGHGGTLAQ